MNWVKQNWDRALLLLISGLVIAGSAMLLLNNSSFKDRFTYNRVAENAKKREIEDTKVSEIDDAMGTRGDQVKWNYAKVNGKNDVPIFKSVILLQKGREVIDMMAGTPLRPPMTNEFLLEHKLDYTRTDVGARDDDDDGFSNLEEFHGVGGKSTNPKDPKSHPPLTDKLYVKGRIEIPYSLEFIAKSSNLYNLRAVEGGEGGDASREYIEEGKLFVERFSVVPGSFETRRVRDPRLNIERDAEFIKVRDEKSGKELELQKRVPLQLPTYQGELLFGLKVDSDLTVDQQSHFGIDEAGNIHAAGSEAAAGATWYRLLQIEETEALISPSDANGLVAEGAPKIRIEHLSKRAVPSTPGGVDPGLPTLPPVDPSVPVDPAVPTPLPTDPAVPTPDPSVPAPTPATPAAPGTPEVPAP